MLKSKWKFENITTDKIIYSIKKKLKLKKKKIHYKRHDTVLYFDINKIIPIHQGFLITKRKITKYHKYLKLGALLKTKKPYFFRSKKKKNVKFKL